ncbi:MAG: response regulator transcription factor [Thermomicrobiales bacterium]
MAHIVLVEDERELASIVAQVLQEEGHVVESIADGAVALRRLTEPGRPDPDLVILDLMLPGVDGLEICRQIRRSKIIPILMLTAKASEIDRVVGLELGADDYVVKPVAVRELQARVTAILRRVEMMRRESHINDEGDRQAIERPGIKIDPSRHEVLVDGHAVALTAKEFDLLYLLVANPGRVFSRDYLLDRIWGSNYGGFDRTVDTHILRLRRKLGGGGSVADRIVTLWGVGYKYDPAATSEGVGRES